jgi:hypothetical protein
MSGSLGDRAACAPTLPQHRAQPVEAEAHAEDERVEDPVEISPSLPSIEYTTTVWTGKTIAHRAR